MSKRRTHSPEFKARVAMEAISGRKTNRVFQQIRLLQIELEWLNNISATLILVNCCFRAITTTQSSASAGNMSCCAVQIRDLLPIDSGV